MPNIFGLILTCVIVVIVFSLLLFLIKRYKKCPSDKVMVIYGKVGSNKDGSTRSAKCIHGGDADHAVRLMLADKMEELMRIQVDAVKGIKIDKVTVWDGGEQKDGKTATAGFVSGLMKSIPPMNEMFDMAGMELPRFLGKNKEEPAAPPAPAEEPGAPAEES